MGSHDAHLTVTERGPLVPEMRAAYANHLDTLAVRIVLDSARGDSLFGHWDADFTLVGTHGKTALDSQPYLVTGRVRGDSVEFRLNPGHTDQDVWLQGALANDEVRGDWSSAYSPRVSGTFVLR
jgi:hypothetical protein